MQKFAAAFVLLLCSYVSAMAVGLCNSGTSNYYGYCKISGGPWFSIQTTFQIPLIAYNGPASPNGATDLLSWVGIGTNLASPVQAGVAQQLNTDGSFTYQAWTGSGTILKISTTTYPVLVGDLFTPNITCATNCASNQSGQTWDFTLTDVHLDGTSWTYTRLGFASVQNTTWAQFTSEAPVYGGGVGYFPNFGIIPWYNSLLNGANPSLVSGDSYVGVDPNNNTYNVSTPTATTDGFVSCYGTATAYTTCANTIVLGRTSAGGAGR